MLLGYFLHLQYLGKMQHNTQDNGVNDANCSVFQDRPLWSPRTVLVLPNNSHRYKDNDVNMTVRIINALPPLISKKIRRRTF